MELQPPCYTLRDNYVAIASMEKYLLGLYYIRSSRPFDPSSLCAVGENSCQVFVEEQPDCDVVE